MAIQRWEMILSARADSYLLKIQGERADVDKIIEAHSNVCRDVQEISDDVFKWAVFIVDAAFTERLAIQNLVMSLTEDSGGKAASSELTEVLDGLAGALEDLTNLTDDEQAFVMKKMARMGNPAEASGAKSPIENPSGLGAPAGRPGNPLPPPPHAKPGPHISKPLPPPVIPGSPTPGRPPGGPLPPVGPLPPIVRPIQPPRPLPPATAVPGAPQGPKGPTAPPPVPRMGPVSIPPLPGITPPAAPPKPPLTPPPTSWQNPADRPRAGGPTPPPAPPAAPHPPLTPPPPPPPPQVPGDKGQPTGPTPPFEATMPVKPPPPPPPPPPGSPPNSMEDFSIEVGWSGGKPGAQRLDPAPPSPAGAAGGGTLPPKIELTKNFEEMVPPDPGKPAVPTEGAERPPTPEIEPLAFAAKDAHSPEAVKPVVTPFGPAVPASGPDPATAPPPDVPRTPRPVNDSVLRICVFYPTGGEADKERFLSTLAETAQKKSKKPMTLEIISAVPTTIALEHATDWIWTAKAGGAECFFVLLPNRMMAEHMEPLHGEARDAGLGCFILEHAEIGAKLRYMDLMMDLMMLKRKGK